MRQIFHCYRALHLSQDPRRPINTHWIGTARNGEEAKRLCQPYLHGDPDTYTVNPLTNPGERIAFSIQIWDD